MNHPRTAKKYVFLFVLSLFAAFSSRAIETEVRYKVSNVKEVYFIWGVNDWQKYPKMLPGTFSKGKAMRTLMKREGDEYVVKLDIDSGYVVDYGFRIIKEVGPFNTEVSYWDLDEEKSKGYFFKPEDRQVIKAAADFNKLMPGSKPDLGLFARNLLLFFGLSALLLFVARRYFLKKARPAFSQAGYFAALTGGLALMLFFIRVSISGQLNYFVFGPLDAIWQMIGAAWDDLKLVGILFAFFGLFFLWLTKWRRTILFTYSFVAFLTVIAALANIRVLSLLGRPFNYQWFYYSGFLKSRDASLAFAANMNIYFYAGILMMVVTVSAIIWLLYQLYLRKNLPVFLVFPVLFLLASVAQFNSTLSPLKAANPILFFVQSVFSTDASAAADKKFAGKSDFEKKNTDSLPPAMAASLSTGKIKNVIFFVLESTPWEYVAPYSNTIKATPFLDEYKNKAVFEKIYAHIPSTNKSMFSFLCGTYPEISFKSITLEHPHIPLPSIPSELKKHGYRTAFFNSGDNQFQDAGTFLKAREFDVVEDFHQGNCTDKVFSDERFTESKLDGVDDSCLSPRFFNWLGADTTTPFFTMMWTFQTHYPYFTTGPLKDYNAGSGTLERYLNALHRADQTLKALVKGLEDRGLMESTLIVVCGDHGEAFGRHDQTAHAGGAYEENLHVPLILMNPTLFNGERMPVLGGISDIAPTIFSLINKPAPAAWQGENLFSVTRRQRVYFLVPYTEYLFGLRDGNLKLIHNITANTYQVFDLEKDPRETTDISKENEAFVRVAKEKLNAWIYYQDEYMKKISEYKNTQVAK
ncbi:MAG TPA: sulfatase-like hydrolase/transferase [Ferruginibacter sp.]|nr:sulfatase-like hydrolase/transferase [Ferruginibacter sp.]HPH91068.1 sulfatase-like hydrolase/transferase [Ferruginibacter sp.]